VRSTGVSQKISASCAREEATTEEEKGDATFLVYHKEVSRAISLSASSSESSEAVAATVPVE
jgi:hypothetical protein